MDLSINKLKKAREKQISFEGVKTAYNAKAVPTIDFTAPPYNSLQETANLELVLLNKKKNSTGFYKPNISDAFVIQFNEQNRIVLNKEMLEKESGAFAYRYRFDNIKDGTSRYSLDGFRTIDSDDGAQFNIIDLGENYGISPKGGTMYHVFVDSNAISDGEGGVKNINTKISKYRRNHFTKLGGSIEGLDALLKTDELDPYTYVMTSPDIGVDPTSSHKYWTNNVYQCNDIKTLKDFIFHLYEKGKGYVADIALTSQSLQSPIVAHALKWGPQSPFYNMLKLENNTEFGVIPTLPKKGEEYEYPTLGVRVINPKKAGYNKNKPTYIQFYDTRLASRRQINDSTKLIDSYDSSPEDPFDIVGYPGSVHQFYFEVDPDDKRLNVFRDKNAILLKDLDDVEKFLSFDYFKIAGRDKASGGTYWDGQVDLVKSNLSNPDNTKENIEAMMNMRSYLLHSAEFWSETIQSDLILRTALMSEKEKMSTAKNNKITYEQMEQIAAAPEEIKSRVLEENKTVEDYIKEFPLQSIETSPELSAIFSEPQFNSELLNEETFEKVSDIANTLIDEAIPERYKDNEDYRTYVVKTFASDIIKKIYVSAFNPDLINADGSIDKEDLKEITLNSLLNFNPVSVEDERKQVVRKIQKSINTNTAYVLRKYIAEKLSKISLDDFRQAEAIVNLGKAGLNWRIDAAKDIADLDSVRSGETTYGELWNGKGKFSGIDQFWANFVKYAKKYNPAALTILELTSLADFYKWNDVKSMRNFSPDDTNNFIEKTAGSLDVIAKKAKGGKVDKDGFLAAANVLRTGKINEEDKKAVLDICDKYYEPDKTRAGYFSESNNADENRTKVLNLFGGLVSKVGLDDDYYPTFYENHVAYAKEQRFLEYTGATTGSNYDKYFNNLSMFAGVNPERYENVDSKAGNVAHLKNQTEHLMRFSQPHATIFSHTFYENHDKPRLMHHLPLDSKLFHAGNLENCSDEQKKLATEITGRTDYKKINSKAIAVAEVMKKAIEKQYENNPEIKNKLLAALRDVTNGAKGPNGKPDFNRADKFGSMAYEDSLPVIFKRAGMYDVSAILNIRYNMLADSMKLEQSVWEVMNAVVGTPTLFNGAEFAQTGNETPSKNVYQANRGEILHGLKNDRRYKPHYDKMKAISSLYKNPQLSALREGYPISLNMDKQDNLDMWPMLKYDEFGSQVLSVITSNRMPKGHESRLGVDLNEIHEIDSIEIKDENGLSGLPDGTILRRKVYDEEQAKFVDDDIDYIVENGKIKSTKGKIKVDDTVLTFYVPNPRLEKHKYMPVYNGAH